MKKINQSYRNSPHVHISSGSTIRLQMESNQKLRDMEDRSTLDFMNNSMMMGNEEDGMDEKSFESQKINFIRDEMTPPRK